MRCRATMKSRAFMFSSHIRRRRCLRKLTSSPIRGYGLPVGSHYRKPHSVKYHASQATLLRNALLEANPSNRTAGCGCSKRMTLQGIRMRGHQACRLVPSPAERHQAFVQSIAQQRHFVTCTELLGAAPVQFLTLYASDIPIAGGFPLREQAGSSV